jgi:RimJ/RimL family protein N-acetyltransferase
MDVQITEARREDSGRLLEWRNESTTRSWMKTADVVQLEAHEAWCQDRLRSDDCLFFIIEAGGEPVGQIRYEREDGADSEVRVSINITGRLHGGGIATRALVLGSEEVRRRGFGDRIIGRIKPDNIACIRAGENAGYVNRGLIDVDGVEHVLVVHDLTGG